MACCEFGIMTLTVDGQIHSARGEWAIKPTNFEREGGANEDGTLWSSKKPVPAEAEGSLDACTFDVMGLADKCPVTVTFEFEKAGSFVYPDARVMGRPELNSSTGEVSGLKFYAQKARKVG